MSWTNVQIGSVCDVIPGFAFKSKDLGDSGIPIVKIGNIKENLAVDLFGSQYISADLVDEKHDKYRLRNKDIVVAMTGATAGKVGRVRYDGSLLLNQRVAKIEAKDINPDFLWFVISSEKYRDIFFNLAGGAAQPNMSGEQIEEVKIPLPPQLVQSKIASILSAYDDLIENNRRRIQLLEESARLLYKEWFVYLRFPGHEHVKVVDGVPEGWEKGTVGELAEVQPGYAFKSEDWREDGCPVIKIKNVVGDNTVDVVDCQCIDTNVAEKAFCFALKEGDLLIAMTGATVGKIGVVPKTEKACFLNQRVGRFKSKKALDVTPFLLSFFNSDNAQTQVNNLAGGAAQPNISGSQIESIELLVPNKKLLDNYLETIFPLFEQRQLLLLKIQKLKQARDLLLPRLMNGEIEV